MDFNKINVRVFCILFIWILPEFVYSDNETSHLKEETIQQNQCIPKIFIKTSEAEWNLCLDRFKPQKDSCAIVIIELQNFSFHFNYNQEREWHYSEVKKEDADTKNDLVRVDQENDFRGNLLNFSIFVNIKNDTFFSISVPKIFNDRIDTAKIDTTKPSKLNIRCITYKCQEVEYKVVVEDRKYTYPPGYMRREPVLNYPELSMFHYGGSVRMPTTISLQRRAVEYFYWHITTPAEIKFDDPEEIRREEEWLNRYMRGKIKEEDKASNKKSRPSFIKLKPLR